MRRIAPRWQPAPTALTLAADALHLWRWPLDREATATDLASLSAAEQQRAARMRHLGRRHAFTLCRLRLRALLARYSGIAAADLDIRPDEQGKPRLHNAALEFNLSHTDGWALLAIAREPVGVDLEYQRPRDLLSLSARFFHPREHQALQLLPAAEQKTFFYRVWTAKEAYLKGIGTGLATPLDSFAVNPHGAGPITATDPSRPLPDWSTYPFLVAADILACVALPSASPIRHFRYYEWA